MADVHVGDIGTRFTLTITENGAAKNISTASEKVISFKPPGGGATKEKAATFVTDGSDGKIYYDSVAGDLDVQGTWQIQGRIVLPSGTWHTELGNIAVAPNL